MPLTTFATIHAPPHYAACKGMENSKTSNHKPVVSCRNNVVQEGKGVQVASAVHDCTHMGHMLTICKGDRAILTKV